MTYLLRRRRRRSRRRRVGFKILFLSANFISKQPKLEPSLM